MRNVSLVVGVVGLVLMLAACGGRSMSAEEMQRKLDSIQKIEVAERLAAQGINLEHADNPLKQFFDSLDILPLPITYSDELVRYLPVDKLCLYAIEDEADLDDFGAEDILQYFTITSDYEIHLMDYSKDKRKTRTEEVFTLNASRNFELQKSEELD